MSNEVTLGNKAELNVPEVWDRKSGDSVVEFAKHLDVRWEIAKGIAKSGMTHHKTPEAVMTIALTAYEIGLPLMQALRGMYVVDGKIGLEGHLMDALSIQRCAVTKTKVRSDSEVCELILRRPGWDDLPVRYTTDDALQAGLIQGIKDGKVIPKPKRETWAKHTRMMLYWRALSEGLRQIAPDYFGGIYHVDELHEGIEIAQAAMQRVSTNEELDALKSGAEPDPDVLDAEDQEQLNLDLNNAVRFQRITEERRAEIVKLLVNAKWAEVRQAWNEVKDLLRKGSADAAQALSPKPGEEDAGS